MTSNNIPARIAVFLSGGGTGLQAFIDAVKRGDLAADITLVVSSTNKAYGLERARHANIDTFVYRPNKYATEEEAAGDLLARLAKHKVEFLALSGYLKLLPSAVVKAYSGRITNIHPALLPAYGGKGMYGRHVHEAVIAAGETESGATVHLVDEIYDHGRILEQARVPVLKEDTVDTLSRRVLAEEHKLYPAVLDKLIRGEYELTND
ncbi:MAG: phosphoribosylglycinamide formyltransferase [candidate division Zixibacteria bacterium]|nr:phosphoribosylglycinamide formyltransferase [candidate division Zixibacteria bacterium]